MAKTRIETGKFQIEIIVTFTAFMFAIAMLGLYIPNFWIFDNAALVNIWAIFLSFSNSFALADVIMIGLQRITKDTFKDQFAAYCGGIIAGSIVTTILIDGYFHEGITEVFQSLNPLLADVVVFLITLGSAVFVVKIFALSYAETEPTPLAMSRQSS